MLVNALDTWSERLKPLAALPGARQTYRALRQWAEPIATKYDRWTVDTMRRSLTRDSNTVDAGAHNGTLLRHAIDLAPDGQHFAFEPLPHLAAKIAERYPTANVHACALANEVGCAIFQHVPEDEALSGLKPRANLPTKPMTVPVNRLDAVLPADLPIRYIKVDVEGGEYDLFRGAMRTLARWQPVTVFEYGPGTTDPYAMWKLLAACGMGIRPLDRHLGAGRALTVAALSRALESGTYYFIARA